MHLYLVKNTIVEYYNIGYHYNYLIHIMVELGLYDLFLTITELGQEGTGMVGWCIVDLGTVMIMMEVYYIRTWKYPYSI